MQKLPPGSESVFVGALAVIDAVDRIWLTNSLRRSSTASLRCRWGAGLQNVWTPSSANEVLELSTIYARANMPWQRVLALFARISPAGAPGAVRIALNTYQPGWSGLGSVSAARAFGVRPGRRRAEQPRRQCTPDANRQWRDRHQGRRFLLLAGRLTRLAGLPGLARFAWCAGLAGGSASAGCAAGPTQAALAGLTAGTAVAAVAASTAGPAGTAGAACTTSAALAAHATRTACATVGARLARLPGLAWLAGRAGLTWFAGLAGLTWRAAGAVTGRVATHAAASAADATRTSGAAIGHDIGVASHPAVTDRRRIMKANDSAISIQAFRGCEAETSLRCRRGPGRRRRWYCRRVQ